MTDGSTRTLQPRPRRVDEPRVLSYVGHDLVRNPRRTIASILGVVLGVGLFSGVLFFIDGSAASMTKRALAPLALDMQRVVTSPLGRDLRLHEEIGPSGPIAPGDRATVTLEVTNTGPEPANEVVVADTPPPPLTYVPGSLTRNGVPVADVNGDSPLAQGPGATGLNLGSIVGGESATLVYAASTRRAVDPTTLEPAGKISSREDIAPVPANAAPPLGLPALERRVAKLRGVAAADGLYFADLPARALRAGGTTIRRPVRVFAFDARYQRHYPTIRILSGGFAGGGALLSAEASQGLAAPIGTTVELTGPGASAPVTVPVSGVVDLSRATPLFSSRKTSKFEDFLYVPDSIVVTPRVFRDEIIPSFKTAVATRGQVPRSLPVLELDVKVRRSRLRSDPGRALAQSRAVAAAVGRIQPDQNYLIDNISNTLEVARDDAVVGKRMFLFLGLPGVLLAGFLVAYAGSVLATAQRRELALLRVRGAHAGHLRRMLVSKTIAFAGAGSVFGVGLGFVAALAILGADSLFEASPRSLAVSGLVAAGVGMLTTSFAQYVPGRRSIGREISEERREIAANPKPAWRRWRLDVALVVAAVVAELIAVRAGAFDPATTSVSAGQAVALPSHFLLAPLIAWLGGMLLAVRMFEVGAARLPVPRPPRYGPLLRGTLGRSLRRRSWAFATGVIGVGLVVAFGVGIAMFAATYDSAKRSDSQFVVGSQLRITPSVADPTPRTPAFARRLRVPGVAQVTPVVFKLENSVLIGRFNQDRADLAAIDPTQFGDVAQFSNSFFVDQSANEALDALRRDPRAILVDEQTADDLAIDVGRDTEVVLARGTSHQVVATFHVVGRFRRFPGFPQGTNLVANLSYYQQQTHVRRVDFFLASATSSNAAGLARAVTNLRAGPGKHGALHVDTRETALDKEQSSLTALNVRGLVDLDSLFTLLMCAAAIGIFVFGLLLQRRREYITLRAQGMPIGQVRALVLGEASLVVACGSIAGLVIGAAMAALFVGVLRPLFILDPRLTLPTRDLMTLGALVVVVTAASALGASAILNRLQPGELLRDS